MDPRRKNSAAAALSDDEVEKWVARGHPFRSRLVDAVAKRADRVITRHARHLPPTYWHYTNDRVPANVLSTTELWASDFATLNDRSELRHLRDMAQEAYRDEAAGPIRPKRNGKVDCESADQAAQLVTKHGLYGNFGQLDAVPYILSLSEADDDINQWRSYGGQARGAALVVGRDELLAHLGRWRGHDGRPPQFWPVIYDDAIKLQLLRCIIDEVRQQVRQAFKSKNWPMDATMLLAHGGAMIRTALRFYGASCKHRGFRSEQEWRVVIAGPPRGDISQGFARNTVFRAKPDGVVVAALGINRNIIERVVPGPRCAIPPLISSIGTVLGDDAAESLVAAKSTIPFVVASPRRRRTTI